MPEPADRIATDLLRLARDPASGRIRNRTCLDVGLRAALFADLAIGGQVIDYAGTPAVTPLEPTGDRMLDAVRDAVARRPSVDWVRWFRYVSTDCKALRNELLTAGRWQQQRRWPATYVDDGSDDMLALAHRLDQVARYEREPDDTREAVLTTLATTCGATGRRPRPGAVAKELGKLVGAIPDETVRRIIKSAAVSMRQRRHGSSVT